MCLEWIGFHKYWRLLKVLLWFVYAHVDVSKVVLVPLIYCSMRQQQCSKVHCRLCHLATAGDVSGPPTKVSIKALDLKCQPSSPQTLLTVLSSLASVSHKQNNNANQKRIRQMIRWHRGSPMCDLLNIRGTFEMPNGRTRPFPESIIFHKSHWANSASAAAFFLFYGPPPSLHVQCAKGAGEWRNGAGLQATAVSVN